MIQLINILYFKNILILKSFNFAMAVQLKYSDILADVLTRRHTGCTCPQYASEFSSSPPRPSTGHSCRFGSNCLLTTIESTTCNYDKTKCTCYGQCACDLGITSPQSQPLTRPKPIDVCAKPNCICFGTCLCKSDDSLLSKSISRPPKDCDKTLCTCKVCLCQPLESPSTLLPSRFRNIVKMESNKLMSEEFMKQECAEIKQLLAEHEANKKTEPEKAKHRSSENVRVKKSPSKKSDISAPKDPSRQQDPKLPTFLETENPPSIPQNSNLVRAPSFESSHKAIKPSFTQNPVTTIPLQTTKKLSKDRFSSSRVQSMKRDKKIQRKEKTAKKKQLSSPTTAKTKFMSSYCGCRSTIKKPLRIRYYYSGSIESYGVKLGHKKCLLPPQQVPKNMGWLWNIEDTSKGLRERKGWPPGFIGKNIKNMMRVMKQSREQPSDWGMEGGKRDSRQKWKSAEFVEATDERKEEPPLLHIHKKGRTYNITFCPKESDEDIGPVPIPFSITEKKREGESDTESSESTLEFELHSPKPRGPPKLVRKVTQVPPPAKSQPTTPTPTKSTKKPLKQKNKPSKSRTSQGFQDETKILWEEQQTQMQNIS